MPKSPKVRFAAAPIPAIKDNRFATTHYRAILVVAQHDGMSIPRGKGEGCWATIKTLAQCCGVNHTNLSTALGELIKWGYLIRETHPYDKRRMVLRVNYDDLPSGKLSSPNDLPLGKSLTQIDSPCPSSIVCPATAETPTKQ